MQINVINRLTFNMIKEEKMEGLISDNYITKNPDSWRKYDFLVTAKGRKLGISRIKKKDGLIKILLSMAAVDVVIRNIRNGRYMNLERSACK